MKLPALPKRLASSVARLVFIFIAFFIFTTPAFAQTSPALTTNTNPDVPKNLHTWTQNVMIEVMAAMSCQLTGIDPINPKQSCLGVDSQTGKIGYVPSANQGQAGGAIGVMGNLIAMTYTPAMHTGDYFGYLAQNFGVVKSAYAQTTGAGFDSLNPIINLWIAFRNLVYLLFVAVFAIVGFGIMLRINIDPRTVMTIANQLPKMIIAILLVTFSFAISGFLIDLMWASIYVTTNVIVSSDPNQELISQETAQKIVQSANPIEAANIAGEGKDKKIGGLARIASEPSESLGEVVTPLFDSGIGKSSLGVATSIIFFSLAQKAASPFQEAIKAIGSWTGLPGKAITLTISTAIGLLAGVAGGANAGSLGPFFVSWIVFIVIVIAILWALFRLTFQLVIAYVTVLIHTVFSPFWIIGGLFPGSPIGFGAWFREMLGALSVFPVTIGMFLLGRIFMAAFDQNAQTHFAPPMTGNPNAGNFGAFIGLGIILLTPQVVTIMKDLFKSPQFKYGGAIAQPLAFGLGAVNAPQIAQKLGMWGYYSGQMRHIPIVGSFFGREETARGRPPQPGG
ncbi:MAG: hypothetical protein HYV39_02050 [Candidatus Levybacteria bacterium]|nr:hypothetical protein [Candidatus Levybacteria bacterium]